MVGLRAGVKAVDSPTDTYGVRANPRPNQEDLLRELSNVRASKSRLDRLPNSSQSEEVIRALVHLHTTHPCKKKLTTGLKYFRRRWPPHALCSGAGLCSPYRLRRR